MCGRHALATPVHELQHPFSFLELPNLAPSYNVAPTQTAPVVRPRPDGHGRELALPRCGLVPPWSEGPSSPYNLINARVETALRRLEPMTAWAPAESEPALPRAPAGDP